MLAGTLPTAHASPWWASDSLLQHYSPYQRLQGITWVAAGEETAVQEGFGKLFTVPLRQPQPSDHLIAVALDAHLNPSPSLLGTLPGLSALAALRRTDLLHAYLQHLRTVSKSLGIDFLVLPEPTNPVQQQCLQRMVQFDDDFFLPANGINRTYSRKKKDMQRVVSEQAFWIIPESEAQETAHRLSKWAPQLSLATHDSRLLSAHRAWHERRSDFQTKALPTSLELAIVRHGVAAMQQQPNTLPLRTDTLCLLTHEPFGALANLLRQYTYVITSFDAIATSHAPVLIDQASDLPVHWLNTQRTVIFAGLAAAAAPYISKLDAALLYPQPHIYLEELLVSQLLGTVPVTGLLAEDFALFQGFENTPLEPLGVLGYGDPTWAGLDAQAIERIEAIVREAIENQATPGCQIAVALKGNIVFEKAYGFLTYDSLIPVDKHTLYDVASVTKVAATLLAVMKLYEQGMLHLDAPLEQHLPDYAGSNKARLTLRELLAHNAGLESYVPFWQRTLHPEFLETFVYASAEDEAADKRTYLQRPDAAMLDSLRRWIKESPVRAPDPTSPYRYSDVGFLILQQVIERVSGMPLDQLVSQYFYEPLGLRRLVFNPLEKDFARFEIAPTEIDHFFRDELVWGQVHDRNAAVLGGVAGHAGLFSNAHDLLVILQLLLQDGWYGGQQYFQAETVAYFNQQYFPMNRRALGWDKPDSGSSHVSALASPHSFGHTGFTGTIAWADPAYELSFVFLSNRIYPKSNNYQLIRRNIRSRIQQVVYESVLSAWRD